MPQGLLISLFLLCFLSSCVSEEWVKDYVASQTGEVKTHVRVINKDVTESKARVASMEEGINLTLKDYGAQLETLRHDLNHLDVSLHDLSEKTQRAMENLEKDVHRDVTNQEGRVAVLLDKVQKMDAEVQKIGDALHSMDKKVQELGDILYPLTGKEVKKK